jgi:hypothetical protein
VFASFYISSFNDIAGAVFPAFMDRNSRWSGESFSPSPYSIFSLCLVHIYIRRPLATYRLLTLRKLYVVCYELRTWRLRCLERNNEWFCILTGICDTRNILFIYDCYHTHKGRDSSVGIANGYGLDGPGIKSRWERDFSHTFRPVLGPSQPPVQWVPVLSQG